MTEEALMTPAPGLLSLPREVLVVIGGYLNLQDLFAVSATCRYLRSVFNVNCLWRKYSEGECVSRALDNTVSVVEPIYQTTCTSLETPCEHRLYVTKQNRLLSNIRSNTNVSHSISFNRFVSNKRMNQRMNQLQNLQITYGGKYLFALDYSRTGTEVIRIFDIVNSPELLLTVDLDAHSNPSCDISWVHVVGDKLVVRRDEWFDIYEIKLPESLERLYSINVNRNESEKINQLLLIGKFLFVEYSTKYVINIWDVSDGKRCTDLAPHLECNNFHIIGYSRFEQLLVITMGMNYEAVCDPQLNVYDVKHQVYSSFNPVLSREQFQCFESFGLIDKDHVIIILRLKFFDLKKSIYVFDYETSSLIASKSDLSISNVDDARIVNGYLVLPSLGLKNIHVMSLETLQTVWVLHSSLLNRPNITCFQVLYISTLSAFLVIHTYGNAEVWEFNGKRKILTVPKKFSFALDDTFSKLIYTDLDNFVLLVGY